MRDMTKEEIKSLDKEHVLHSWSVQGTLDPMVVTKAEGIYFYDADGNKYYDMSSQLVNLNIGYGNERVADAIAEQAHKLPFIGPGYAVDVKSELARRIVELAGDNFSKVFFTLGGADANENAVKIARMYTGRNKVFSRYRSYHGSSFGAGNLTGEPRLELKVITLNINEGHNKELMEQCQILREYAQYVARVRKYTKEMNLDVAVERAVDECIREGILENFLRTNRAEVIAVSIFEYNKDEEEKKLRRAEYEAGYDSGFDAGKETELNNLLHRMLKNRKYSDTDIAEVTGIAAEKIKEIRQKEK